MKNEESYTVDGLHEAIIRPTVFYEVQNVLEGRKRQTKTKIVTHNMLALKGFITCPKCGKVLPGSASKGRTQYYHYYHCSSACGYRKLAEGCNTTFTERLRDYVLDSTAAGLFKSAILDTYSHEYQSTGNERKQFIERITALNNKVTKARELLLNDDIDAADFKAVKTEAEREITILEAKISELQTSKMSIAEVEKTLDMAIEKLTAIDAIYSSSDNYAKHKLIGSIYPEKFTIEDIEFRTAKRSDVFEYIEIVNT